MIYRGIEELVGNTPLVTLNKYCAARGAGAEIVAKAEFFNPAGSVKDRVALHILNCAERDGKLKRGGVIIEPTSGNTGIGLAALGCARGYRVILTMPENMSSERRRLIAAYGAEIVLTGAADGMRGAIEAARELAAKIPGAFIPDQFANPANAQAHYLTTGPEIWNGCEGKLQAFVAGVGTGGTVTGVGKYLKERDKNISVIAVEPQGSPVLSKGYSGAHGIQGIGAGFVPKVLDTRVYDEVLAVSEEQAFGEARALAKCEGLLAGISSGAALYAALQLSKRARYAGGRVVVLLPDTGARYLSTPLFGE